MSEITDLVAEYAQHIREKNQRIKNLESALDKAIDALDQTTGELELWKEWAKNNADEFGQVRRISKQIIVAIEARSAAKAVLEKQ